MSPLPWNASWIAAVAPAGFAGLLRAGLAPSRRTSLRGLGDRLAGLEHRGTARGTEVSECVDELLDRRVRGEYVDPQAVFLRGLGGGRADHRDDRRGVRLAGDADQVAHRRGRGEHHGVELAGL